jgi:hypothetical protein
MHGEQAAGSVFTEDGHYFARCPPPPASIQSGGAPPEPDFDFIFASTLCGVAHDAMHEQPKGRLIGTV